MYMLTHSDQFKAATIYNAAADYCDKPSVAFWSYAGQRTVDQLAILPGQTILDVCCGTGASALLAARRVGAQGRVLAIDLASNALKKGQEKAAQEGLVQLDFRLGDMTDLGLPDNSFDAVICVFGIFFVEDMVKQIQTFLRLLCTGGQLAITTWGPGFFEPVYPIWLEALAQECPDLNHVKRPWDRIHTVDAVQQLLQAGGARNTQVTAEDHQQPLGAPDDWWTMVLGSGLRGSIDKLGAASVQRVRDRTVNYIHQNGIQSIGTNMIYGIATK